MARWMIGAGIGVLVAGMITIGLALYFGFDAGWDELVVIGGIITVPGLVLLGVGGALRFVGALLLVVGIIGTVLSVLFGLRFLPGIVMSPFWYLIMSGIWWGPPLFVIGLASFLVARQSRGQPFTA